MLRPTTVKKGDDEELQAQTQEVALNTPEELIRKKRSYGTELGKGLISVHLSSISDVLSIV